MTYKIFEQLMNNGARLNESWGEPYKYFFHTMTGRCTIRQDFVFKYMKENKVDKKTYPELWLTVYRNSKFPI